MVIRRLSEILRKVRGLNPVTFAVAAPHDVTTLRPIAQAKALGIMNAILVGDGEQISSICNKEGLHLNQIRIVNEPIVTDCVKVAARLVGVGEASCLMKGLVDTSKFMQGVLEPESQLSTGQLISHIALLESTQMDRILLSTDGAITIRPSYEQKIQLVKNMLVVTRVLEIEHPRIAVLAAIEKVSDKIEATHDAYRLASIGREGAFEEAIVDGPLSFDSAVSSRAARTKGIVSEVAGRADGLICPDLESAVVVVKSAVYLGGVRNAGIVVGARAPIVLTSRSDTQETKLFSIALACLLLQFSKL